VTGYTAEANPGDFIYVPPFVPHQEINASPGETLECVLVRSDNEAVVVHLTIEPVEPPENVPWIDPIHLTRETLRPQRELNPCYRRERPVS
jgi:uncharacterized RmlC-like cupin family protein